MKCEVWMGYYEPQSFDLCLAFDDVLLVPKKSENRSRLGVDTRTKLGPLMLDLPLISSPMDTVTESEMAASLGKMGGMGVIHRFTGGPGDSLQERVLAQIELITEVEARRKSFGKWFPIVPAVGVGEEGRAWFDILVSNSVFDGVCDMVSIDIANGHSILMKEMIEYVKSVKPNLPIMAGNVATGEGFLYLAEAGADAIRVGIGGGSICKTRIQTGFGVPTFASVLSCARARSNGKYSNVAIIADGGIKKPQDLVKSLAAGADAVICGGVFAGTQEAPGKIIMDNIGKAWKEYRGMASEEMQVERRGGLKKGTCAEGVSTLTRYKGSLERVVNDFVGGYRSALTYAGASNILELRNNATFIRITEAGVSESHAYGTRS